MTGGFAALVRAISPLYLLISPLYLGFAALVRANILGPWPHHPHPALRSSAPSPITLNPSRITLTPSPITLTPSSEP